MGDGYLRFTVEIDIAPKAFGKLWNTNSSISLGVHLSKRSKSETQAVLRTCKTNIPQKRRDRDCFTSFSIQAKNEYKQIKSFS